MVVIINPKEIITADVAFEPTTAIAKIDNRRKSTIENFLSDRSLEK
jgi:hypothetical protein